MPENRPTKRADRTWIPKALAGGMLQSAGRWVAEKLGPFVMPTVALAIGLVREVDWFRLAVGTSIAFAAGFHFLVKWDEWRERRRVEGRLRFAKILVGRDDEGPGLVFSLVLQNFALIPVEWQVVEAATRVSDRVPILEGLDHPRSLIGPGGRGKFKHHPIIIQGQPKSVEAFAKFQVAYGREGGKLQHELVVKHSMLLEFTPDGLFKKGTIHQTA
jgi:hypothetical protein